MKKGIKENGNFTELIIGQVYSDGSFGEYLRLYNDDKNTFQIEFLKGSDLAYTFLPKCTELLEIMEEGLVGLSFKDLYKELTECGYKSL